MTKQDRIVTLKTGKLAKEKGFDWLCDSHTNERDGDIFPSETQMTSYRNYNEIHNCISRPTQSKQVSKITNNKIKIINII